MQKPSVYVTTVLPPESLNFLKEGCEMEAAPPQKLGREEFWAKIKGGK